MRRRVWEVQKLAIVSNALTNESKEGLITLTRAPGYSKEALEILSKKKGGK